MSVVGVCLLNIRRSLFDFSECLSKRDSSISKRDECLSKWDGKCEKHSKLDVLAGIPIVEEA
jgi:hypothetical protein